MDAPRAIAVLVVDDHVVVREGLCSLIEARPGMEVVGEASDGVEAVEKAKNCHPDVILMDMVMPKMDGVTAIRKIKRHDADVRILVLTSFGEDKRVHDAVKAGALGYLLKDSSATDLIRAIEQVYRGELSLQPALALKIARELNRPSDSGPTLEHLTEREEDVFRLLAQGKTDREIAQQLSISERTVNKHVSNILGKLRLANRTQAALYALRSGMVNGEDR